MLAALVLAAGCSAPQPFPVPGEFVTVLSGVEARVSRQRLPDLAEVMRAPACNEFTPVDGQPNFGAIGGSLWLRLHPVYYDRAGTSWRLVVRFVGLQTVCAHWPVAGGYAHQCQEHGAAWDRGAWRNGRLVFVPPGDYDAARPVFLYAESDFWLKAPLELATGEALLERESAAGLAWGFYYGLIGAFIVVSLGFYFGRRDQAFLFFAGHMAVLTLALATWQGLLAPWDLPSYGMTRLMPALVALALALGVRFYQTYLLTRRYCRSAHRVLSACGWAALLLAVPVGYAPVQVIPLLGALALVWLGAILWAAIARTLSGYRPALWVLAAVSVLMVATVLNALSTLGIGFHHQGLRLAFVGNFVATVFLVLGLIYRVRALAAERDRANEVASANRNLALYRAHFDELTGLPKRTKFKEDLQLRIAGMGAPARRLAVVTLSPDRFREVNQALGHDGGDAVLVEIATRLRRGARPGELLARVGAASFAQLIELDAADGLTGLDARCAALRRALVTPLMSGRGAVLSISMGAALYPDHGAEAEQLLRCSDAAYDRAREQGGGALRIFETRFHQQAERYLELNQELRQSLDSNELDLHFQPLCTLADGRMVAAEALLRWHHKGHDLPPDLFVPIAESSDLIAPLTDWVFQRACRQARDWQTRGLSVPLCVNVSAPQFRLPDFIERLDRALADSGVPPTQLSLEITESLLMDDLEATRATLAQLRERGIDVAVDDFGVGYSSLAYLRTLPVRSVKIDRSFLLGVPNEPESVAVINAIIALGRDLRLQVIAEGIETEAQHEFLVARGVIVGQGFRIARPMTAAALEEWLRERYATATAAA